MQTTPLLWGLFCKLLLLLMAGIAIYSIYKARIFISNNTFSIHKFIIEGWRKWLWSFTLGAIIQLLVITVPGIDQIFTQFLGINITNSVAGAVFLGIGLMGLAHNEIKSKK